MTKVSGKRMLTPDWNYHRETDGDLAVGATLVNATPAIAVVGMKEPVAWGHYWKSTCAGTLRYRYRRPDLTTDYATAAHADVAVLANTEVLTTVTTAVGQGALVIDFLPSAGGVIVISDVCARSGS